MARDILQVCTNISSMHREKSFLSELTTQILFGESIEILEDNGDWVYGKCLSDSYKGYTYRNYLDSIDLPTPTHIVSAPQTCIFSAPRNGIVLSRIFGGTKTSILDQDGEWSQINVHQTGWVPTETLRSYQSISHTTDELRAMVCQNALSLIGVPYLWGGGSANGIDCSGLAQWSYRLAGIQLLRDAHEQMDPALSVEAPFEPGDLVFYGQHEADQLHITHVSISLGGWTVIHSSRSRNGVYIDDVQKTPHLKESFCGAVRIIS